MDNGGDDENENKTDKDNKQANDDDDNNAQQPIITRAGRNVHCNQQLIKVMGAAISEMRVQNYTHALTGAKQQYKTNMFELGLVGAGIRRGFEITSKLHPMKYKEDTSGNNSKG